MRIRYAQIALLLTIILLVSLGLTAALGMPRAEDDHSSLSVVASFYPMYTAALQVADDVPGVTVRCLTQPFTGCIHEYQLAPAERAVLETADVLVLNGAGAEAFLDSVLAQLPSVRTVDASQGLALPQEEEQDHDHEEGHHHAVNEHVWMNPQWYIHQVERIRDGLCAADPAHREQYTANAARYRVQIEQAAQALAEAAGGLRIRQALLFHDSMAYLAQSLELTVLDTLPVGEEQALSVTDMACAADRLRGQSVLFVYDDQYPQQLTELTVYADRAEVVSLNSAVQPANGVADADAWLWAMAQNAQRLKEAAG